MCKYQNSKSKTITNNKAPIKYTITYNPNYSSIIWGKNFKYPQNTAMVKNKIKPPPYPTARRMLGKNFKKISHKSKTSQKMSHKTPLQNAYSFKKE